MTKKRKKYVPALVAACLALVLMSGGLFWQQNNSVASIVSLDVNPSIELKVNKNEKVLECQALNEEAAVVLFDMDGGKDLKGTDLDVAVNAIVGVLVRNGYLDSISSAILISVEDKDQTRAAKLQQELTATVDGVLQQQASEAAVLSQTVQKDKELEKQAAEKQVSTGKAYLINSIMAKNSSLTFDGLAALSVEELKDLRDAGAPQMPIGKEEALRIAKEDAGLADNSIVRYDVDAELDDDEKAHYEVELVMANAKLEVKVDAYSGAILTKASGTALKDPLQGTVQQPAGSDATDIGEAAAKAAAFKHAGIAESDVKRVEVEREIDDGRLEYEIDFYAGNMEYDYTIAGLDGTVLKAEKEQEGKGSQTAVTEPVTTKAPAAVTDIGKDGAKAAALKHAGLSESEVSGLRIEKDYDDGRLEYEVDFRQGQMEYEYTIDGKTGSVLEHEKDWDD